MSRRLTRRERAAILDALNFALAGELEVDGETPEETERNDERLRAAMESARLKMMRSPRCES